MATKWDSNSIVDYLKSQGQDSSFSARKKLAESMGITNYTGSSTQNTQLLNSLKNGSSTNSNKTNSEKNSPTTNNPTTTTDTPTTPAAAPEIPGVDQSTTDQMNAPFSQSEELVNKQDIISQNTRNTLNNPFSASNAYTQAMNYTNGLLQQLSSGRTSYTDQVKEMMSKIQNRDKFSYDADSDQLFQQALASAMSSGKTAMQDTIGQASALTGGYGSTYATSAGNQAYNAFIEDAYNNLPEYYQMALEAYQMEGQDMYTQLAMLSEADAQEYQRMYDSWNANFANATQMHNREYGAWQDSVDQAMQMAQMYLGYDLDKAKLEDSARQFDASHQLELDKFTYAKEQDGKEGENDEIVLIKFTPAEKRTALKHYNEGTLEEYVASFPENMDIDDLMAYIEEYSEEAKKTNDSEKFNWWNPFKK